MIQITTREDKIIIQGIGTFPAAALEFRQEANGRLSVFNTWENRFVIFQARSEVVSDEGGNQLITGSQTIEQAVAEKLPAAPPINAPTVVEFGAKNKNGRDSLPNAAFTKLTQSWDEVYLPHAAFNAATGRFTAPYRGNYVFGAHVTMQINDGNKLIVALHKNGNRFGLLGRGVSRNRNYTGFGGSMLVPLRVNDYVEVFVYQDGGNGNSTISSTGYQSFWGYLKSTT